MPSGQWPSPAQFGAAISRAVSTGNLPPRRRPVDTRHDLKPYGASEVTELEAAYAAGIFDGDGCIHSAPYRKRGRPYHRLVVAVTNTDFHLLDWLHARWGGHLGKPLLRSGCRPCKILMLSEGYS